MRAIIFLLLVSASVSAQVPQVPSRMEFGGIKLVIDDPARREIQESVDALTANPKYFDVHVQRARSYFPIIERVFREENVPLDFKYLVLQESALIPDAVSSSDAVGFWQFKDFTALEMGLRVDRTVDERMNIVASSRAAARYMKKNNARYFDNWLITLMAYQMGPGAAIKAGGEKYKGDRTMNIDRRTYWYIKKFLAHKVAFENFVDGPAELRFVEITNGAGKSLVQVADDAGAARGNVTDYNKWLRKGKIPDDKMYTVLLPVSEGDQPLAIAGKVVDNNNVPVTRSSTQSPAPVSGLSRNYDIAEPLAFPEFSNKKAATGGKISDINGKPAVIARVNDRVATLASRGGITVSKFLRFNDLESGDKILEGQVYYLRNKRSRPKAYYHVVAQGEGLWEVSQKYGMKLKKLRQRNRIRTNSNSVEEGRILWLRFIRPADVPVEYKRPPKKDSIKVEPKEVITSNKSNPESGQQKLSASPEAQVTKKEWSNTPAVESSDVAVSEDVEMPDDSRVTVDDTKYSANKEIVHRVKSGETLYSISKQYNVPIQEMMTWNGIGINDPLAIDQELIIKKPVAAAVIANNLVNTEVETAGEQYVVKSGDTLYGIAREFNLTLDELKQLNNKTENTIKPGEKLKVSK